MRCWGLPRVANPAYLSRFLFYALLRVARYCVPGGVKVVCQEVQLPSLTSQAQVDRNLLMIFRLCS